MLAPPDPSLLLAALNRLLFGAISAGSMASATRAFRRGDAPAAQRWIALATRAAPDDFELLGHAIGMQHALGDTAGALRRGAQALARSPGRDPGHELMLLLAMLRMPGPNYIEVLKAIHAELRPRTYVEVGVAQGHTIVLAGPATRAIGIDPHPEISQPLPAGTAICAETSDAFFARSDLADLLGGLPVDLGFIDGMHQFEFALRDFINMEKLCTARSTILIHDCYPLDRQSAERERRTVFWTGDLWRLVLALKKHRPELRVQVIAAAPTGLCVVRGLDPASRVLAQRYAAIVGEFMALDFGVLAADQAGSLNLVPNSPESLRRSLQ